MRNLSLGGEESLSVHHPLCFFTSLTLRYCRTHSLDVDWPNEFFMLSFFFTDAENFEPDEPIKKAAAMDKWEGEDEEEDVKVREHEKSFWGGL